MTMKTLLLVDSTHHHNTEKVGRAMAEVLNAIVSKQKLIADHQALRIKLQTKGFILVDEFCCLGFNTNSFLKYFGGMNKGRPNEEDLQNAKRFAETLKARFYRQGDSYGKNERFTRYARLNYPNYFSPAGEPSVRLIKPL